MSPEVSPAASPTPLVWRALLPPATLARLAIVWSVVLVFATLGASWLAAPIPPAVATAGFVVLFATILYSAFGVVAEADHLAHDLGEPYGTLILTISIVTIEVILIAAVLLGPGESATIARDSIFAVMMIILNLVTGICLLFGGLRHGEQEYNSQGAVAYLSMIVLLTGTALIVPNALSAGDGTFLPAQAVSLALITALLYAAFLALQMRGYRRFFVQPRQGALAVGGLIIAIIVFTPESITAVRAAMANQMQRAINLCLGAFVSTVGLTVPVVLLIGLATQQTVTLGLGLLDTVLLVITVLLSTLTFLGLRTSPVQGMMHLALFAIYVLLLFVP